jgi:MinD-like ATPase involved in chromosome partitioning or flagellar assembly
LEIIRDKNHENIVENNNKVLINNKNNKGCSNILAIVSNKGGAGKTSTSVCVGFYFAVARNRKTLLLEMDSSPGDFGPLFDIENDYSLDFAIKFPERFKNYVKSINKNLDVLKGFSNPINAESITETEILSLFKYISESYEVIVIDTQSVLSGIIIDVLKLSDVIIVLSEPTIESLSRVSELICILNNKFLIDKSKFQLVINKKKIIDFFKIRDIAKVLNFPVNGFINFDKRFNKNLIIFDTNKLMRTRFNIELNRLIKNLISSGVINEFTGKA